MTKRAGVIAGMFVFAIITSVNGSATAQITADQQSAIRGSCRSDFQSKCSGVTPGGQDALACLQKNVASLAPACKTAVAATMPAPATPAAAAAPNTAPKPAQAQRPAASGGAMAPTATAAVPAAPAVAPLNPRPFVIPQRRLVIEGICHSDAAAFCSGSLPIGSQMIDCLARHASSLSKQCYDAIARISQ